MSYVVRPNKIISLKSKDANKGDVFHVDFFMNNQPKPITKSKLYFVSENFS